MALASGPTASRAMSPRNFTVTWSFPRGVHEALGAPLPILSRSATRATRRALIASRSRATNARTACRLFVGIEASASLALDRALARALRLAQAAELTHHPEPGVRREGLDLGAISR